MAKYELWINLYPSLRHNVYASREHADKFADSGRIECRKIEWESKEPVRVADYLVEDTFFIVNKTFVWLKQTHPIGQQPDGSVLVPNSERNQE